MIPGEIIVKNTEIEINKHHPETVIEVKNTGDRPIQVGSHFHFFEANKALEFDREKAYGKHLDIPAGAAVRFERRKIYGFRGLVDGDIDEERVFRPNDSNQNAAVKNDAGEDNANKKGGK